MDKEEENIPEGEGASAPTARPETGTQREGSQVVEEVQEPQASQTLALPEIPGEESDMEVVRAPSPREWRHQKRAAQTQTKCPHAKPAGKRHQVK